MTDINNSVAENGDSQNTFDQLVEQVNSVPLDVKKRIFKAALKTAEDHGNEVDLVRHAVGTTSLAAKKAAVGEAVETTPDKDEQKNVLEKGFKEADSATQSVITQKYAPSQKTLDDIWRWIVKTFAFVLGASTVGLLIVIVLDGLTQGVTETHVQIMLTTFTTVAGILAGFITGQALGKASE